ncbi:hypothetical protein [Actinomadura rudentiformis]|uniref:Uncharacterized protein n=1 Tax=Actinomadura rudentiformis TaxID=359158 RepID=A0A6H9YLU5_9ACTN|nr:hypothetical protein [Actinomadura rudentiformis]KAB2345628.1 hypothetical protein F8566_27200 [Actinomadura rudentiformis]
MSEQHIVPSLADPITRRRAITLALAAGAGSALGGAASASAAARAVPPTGQWNDVPIPVDTPPQLFGVAAPTPHHAFAIGQHSWQEKEVTTALHWNGREWLHKDVPPIQWSWYMDMAAAGPHAAWVMGLTLRDQLPTGLYWNGFRWREAPLPRTGTGGISLPPAVDAEPGGTAWAVLSEGRAAGQSSVLRFERGAWVRKTSPPLPEGSELMTIAVRSPRDVWVGAADRQSSGGSFTFHWDGRTWSRHSMPGSTVPSWGSMDILPVSRKEVWAYVGGGSSLQQLFRLDGDVWTKVTDVPRYGMFPMPYGGSLVSDRNGGVWLPALGEGVGSGRTGYLHWDGTEWARVLGPMRDTSIGFVEAQDMVAIPGTRSIWAVGVQGTGVKPFIERFDPS